jgi:hypothetical protein
MMQALIHDSYEKSRLSSTHRSMDLEMKVLLAMAPVCLVALVYALTQGAWDNAALLAFSAFTIFRWYRLDKRIRSSRQPGDDSEA